MKSEKSIIIIVNLTVKLNLTVHHFVPEKGIKGEVIDVRNLHEMIRICPFALKSGADVQFVKYRYNNDANIPVPGLYGVLVLSTYLY